MRSKQLDLSRYGRDKINHGYLEVYGPILVRWTDREIRLLEIGIRKRDNDWPLAI